VRNLREVVEHYDRDRFFKPDIDAAKLIITAGLGRNHCSDILPSLAA
jgi:histidine ammonia-lyase